jgi:hypothetical protein
MSDTNVHRVVGNLLVGSSHFFVDTTNNKVGINTSSPSASLDIATGDLKVGSGITLASGGTITATAFDGDGSLLQNINSDSGSWVKDNVNSKIYVSNTDHRVAIGTTSASELLTVGNDGVNADVVNNIRLNGRKVNADGEICGLYFANSKDAGDGTTGSSASIRASRIGGSNFATQLDFYTNDGVAVGSGTSRLTILGSGNVGIGRASPQQNLHVHESGSGQVVIAVTNDTTGGGNNDGIHFGIDSSEQGFVWHKQNTALLFATNNTERMRVTNDGKLGIGTTSPSGVLHVVDSSANVNSGWNKLLIRPTTLWGDGVTTAAEDGGGPYRYMTMANIMLQNPHVCCSTAGQSAHIRIGRGGGVSTGEWWDLATRTDNKFQICKSAVATTGIVIDTGGRVGIGTASPGAILEVISSSEIPRLRGDAGRSLFMGSNYTHVNSTGFSETSTNYAWDGYPGVVRMNGGGEWRVHGEAGHNVLIRTDGGFVPFTGLHETYLPFDEDDQGKIVYSTGDYASELKDGNVDGVMYDYLTILDACPVVKICATENDKRVMGVLSTRHRRTQIKEITKEEYELITGDEKYSYEKKEGSDMYIRDIDTDEFSRGYYNAVGEGSIWVCNKNGNFENGDYITSSTVAGYGQKQNDDLLHNYTVAKITADCDFSEIWVTTKKHKKTREGYLFDENNEPVYENILDAEGNTRTHLKFKIRYLLSDGTQISEEEYTTKALANEEVYIAAFVGCTYHCG